MKIPAVAATAPGNPATRNPTNVAEITTGPGEIIPMATASRNSRLPSQRYWSTTYAFRNGTMTSPLPNTRHPVLKKKKKSDAAPGSDAAAELDNDVRGARNHALPDSLRGETLPKRKMPASPAAGKIATSSFSETAVIANAARKRIHAGRSALSVRRPRLQHALTMSATTTGPTP